MTNRSNVLHIHHLLCLTTAQGPERGPALGVSQVLQ